MKTKFTNGMTRETWQLLRTKPNTRDRYRIRAFQYACALRGIETGHHSVMWAYCAERDVRWDCLPDQQRRIRKVSVYGEWVAIPNWDFVPTVIDESQPELMAA